MGIRVVNSDITKMEVDAIVNATNKRMMGTSGVDGAIHRAAGKEFNVECASMGGCNVGEAKITNGYKLPAKYVIHTVGPRWKGGTQGEAELLADCYRNSIRLANEKHLCSVAFPAISTGTFKYPKEQAAEIAVKTIVEELVNTNNALEVLLVAFDLETSDLYNRFIMKYNPVIEILEKGGNDSRRMEIVASNSNLLDIFVTEEDKSGTNLAQMSDFFGIFIGKMIGKMELVEMPVDTVNVSALLGQITSAIKIGYDVSELNVLVADTSRLGKDVLDGIKKGIYYIGDSKADAGNFRAAVIDKETKRIVKQITLKKAINPGEIISDITVLSMQIELREIASEIARVGKMVEEVSEFQRMVELDNKFLYARDRIMRASNEEDRNEMGQYLKKADEYLAEGLWNLYTDTMNKAQKLANLDGADKTIEYVDRILKYMNDNLQSIPRFVGFRAYLMDYQERTQDLVQILQDYKCFISKMTNEIVGNCGHTAFELMHQYYPYENSNMDFWITEPPKMLEKLNSCEKLLDQQEKEFIYVEG